MFVKCRSKQLQTSKAHDYLKENPQKEGGKKDQIRC